MSRPYMTNGVMRGKIRWFHHGLSRQYRWLTPQPVPFDRNLDLFDADRR